MMLRPPRPQVRDHRLSGAARVHGWTGLRLDHLDPEIERPYWIVASMVPGIGPVTIARLVAGCGSLRAAWSEGALDAAALRAEGPADARAAAARELARIRRRGILRTARDVVDHARQHRAVPIAAFDRLYPASLGHLDPRPPLLWTSGSPEAWMSAGVAVVGTRRPSSYGRAAAEEIGDELARAGVVVVSGLAVGIDAAAHRAAVAAGGRSIAVLPSPIDRLYPPIHVELASQMVAAGGALVSELPPGRPVGRPDFARRNRVIAGLAEAVVVVEAPDRSGALLTADAAIGYGRELLAVPGPMDAVTSRGTNRLIADHVATLVTSPAAVLHLVGVQRGRLAVSVRAMSEAEGLVLGTILNRSGSIEELVSRTRLTTSTLAATLTMLEARGLVTAYAGATFHATLEARRSGWGSDPGAKRHSAAIGA